MEDDPISEILNIDRERETWAKLVTLWARTASKSRNEQKRGFRTFVASLEKCYQELRDCGVNVDELLGRS